MQALLTTVLAQYAQRTGGGTTAVGLAMIRNPSM
ncbi:O6-methylguanine-DNA--protein-cysteine methyltransferase [Paraburkholderia atlantica]